MFSYDDPLSVSGVLRAVVENDLNKVKQLIKAGKSPNINDNHGNTPLHAAVIRNLSDILDYLLKLDATEVNVRNFYGETPLFFAIKYENLHLVEKLILANANVNLCKHDDVTPLHIAVKYPNVVHLLIKNGANIDAIDFSGETPLHEAINENCLETVCMLLYYNADANIRCDNDITPFMKAIIIENVEMQDILIDYVTDFNEITKDGMTTLSLALTHQCPHVEEIVKRGADVNHQHPSVNSFSICLQARNKEYMKIIWPRFKYQPLFNDIPYLESMILESDEQVIKDFLRIIIDSGNLAPIFKYFDFKCFYLYLYERVEHKETWLDLTFELLCLYLCEGNVLRGDIISQLYMLFGYSELLRICLHMDIDQYYTEDLNMGLLLSDFSRSIEDLKSFLFRSQIIHIPIKQFLPFIRVSGRITICDIEDLDLRDELQGIPSLLELARNATRDYLVSNFDLKVSKKYYLFVQNMSINTIYKDILTFKKAIYKK